MVVTGTSEHVMISPQYHSVHRTAGANPSIAYTLYEPDAPTSDLTLLFLHGAAHDERCWQYHWTAYLAQHGCRCLTLSYRAHGESGWSRPVSEARLDDYVADVNTVLEALGLDAQRVILIGHSLGGGVAQRFAAQQNVAGLVLMASLAFGVWMQAVWRSLPFQVIRHPRVYPKLRADPSLLFQTPALVREYLLGQDAPDALVDWYFQECRCHESGKALFDMMQAKPQPLRTSEILLLAGRRDSSVPLSFMRRSAAELRATLVELEGAPHDMMLTQWRQAADAVWAFAQQCQRDQAKKQGEAA